MQWFRRIATIAAAAAVAATIVGAAGEATMRRDAERRFPPAGRLVDVGGGRRLQLDCRGAGSPTVVLEAGLDHLGALAWAAVHDSLARTTRTCAYSRAGILWSDAAPGAFDARRNARDLHAALAAAGESAPWVMVAHSLGGPYALLFTDAYPAETRGLVLVDASHPDQVARLEAATGHAMTPPTGLLALGATLAWTGIARLAPDGAPDARWPARAVEVPRALLPRSLAGLLAETRALRTTLAEAGGARRLGDRPLVVLTAMAPMDAAQLAANGVTRAEGERVKAAWKLLQDDEATLSSESRHELLYDASHYIQFDRPDAVIRAVREVVGRVRTEGGQR